MMGRGAGECLFLVLIVPSLVFSIVLLIRGYRKCNDVASQKRRGYWLILLGLSIPGFWYFGPQLLFRLEAGSYPLKRFPTNIREGMTQQEVIDLLRQPHEVYKHDRDDTWYYYFGYFNSNYFGIVFNKDGRVLRTFVD
jgi:hypothetical protein